MNLKSVYVDFYFAFETIIIYAYWSPTENYVIRTSNEEIN